MDYTLTQDIFSLVQAEEVFEAIIKISNNDRDEDTILLTTTISDKRLSHCENNVQLAHFMNILSFLQCIAFLNKHLYLNESKDNPLKKMYLVSSSLFLYVALYHANIYKSRTFKKYKCSIKDPIIFTPKHKLQGVIEIVSHNNVSTEAVNFILTEKTNILETFLNNFHHNLIDTNNLYHHINLKIFGKQLLNLDIPKWKYRYIHNLFKNNNLSPILVKALIQDIDTKMEHIDVEELFDTLIGKTLLPIFKDHIELFGNVLSDVDVYYKILRYNFLKIFKHNKKFKKEFLL